MKQGLLSAPIFHDANKAREWLEARLWKDGTICPKCGVVGQATLLKGKSTRPGLYQCNVKECREPFTVTVGTLYERSKVPLNKWLAATYLLMASKKGVSALQVGRMLGVSKKTAWFLCHRIRESVKLNPIGTLGGEGKIVEADETYFGKSGEAREFSPRGLKYKGKKTAFRKRAVVSLVERGGNVRSFHVPRADAVTVAKIVNENISHESKLYTDESKLYTKVGEGFETHETVNHSRKEYVRGTIHSNTVENYFSVFKRGMGGVYQHCGEKHLHRYLAEFDYRYNMREGLGVDDAERFEKSIPGIVGKRLTYRRTREAVV